MKIKNLKFKIKNYCEGQAPRHNSGQAALVMVFFLFFISVAATGGLASFASSELKSANTLIKSKQIRSYTEGSSEDAAYRVIVGKNVPSQFSYAEGGLSATTTATLIYDDEGNVDSVDILTDGAQANIKRKINVLMEKVYEVNFLFGGLVGSGGIFMQNTSSIFGDVHTNGSVTGNNFPVIDGNVSAVGTISDPPQVLGTKTEGAPFQEMPVPESILDGWEDEAEDGGVYSGACPYKPADGTTLGPIKIPCDVEINGTKIVTLTGKLWISGNLDVKNSAKLRLASFYGSRSEVVIAHNPADENDSGKITVQNSAQLLGSGTAGSYIMMISRNRSAEQGGDEEAIDVKNSSSASIYYAPHGKVIAQNSSQDVHLKTVVAWKLELKNSSLVEYEETLASVRIPAEKWAIGSWQEKP
ncbi:MAG: hypothetical protein A2931_03180 [Candidatus Niyogibacteria bacterium RIFCSPLOWO2_01_FULL_45_48]|uniref:Type 4 fimbrial biogenesis protein PilX N-terminal domain-containing protein n=1 Tax=Candidatus Niyogibacteria bacterium RIFCSPLOWO2_01_FULL_45_48 TaxID=1801724 RepID=A0A1G2EZS2_9BACT|nr:MAG: hypothetical protein A2931_03180 [Candidatus Niyogibacteria bacterium RIFCSPLOWO2_01_FULL_45_48]